MGSVENQKYLSDFIASNSDMLQAISEENPALYNALGDAFQLLSQRFGTAETIAKKKLPKTPKKAKKEVKVQMTAEDLVKKGQHFVTDTSVLNTTVYVISEIDRYENKIQLKWNNADGSVNYTYDEAVKYFKKGVWIPTLADGTLMNVEIIKEPTAPPVAEVAPEPTPQAPTPTTIDITKAKKRKMSIDDVIAVGNKFYNRQTEEIFTIASVEDDFIEVDFKDSEGDIQTQNWSGSNVERNLNDLLWLLDDQDQPLIIQKTAAKPSKKTTEKLAELQLELETQELLAEIGDTDAIKEVKRIKEKIEFLKMDTKTQTKTLKAKIEALRKK